MRRFRFAFMLGTTVTACFAALLSATAAEDQNDNDSDREESRSAARDENRPMRGRRDDDDRSRSPSRQRSQSSRQQGHVSLGVVLYNDDSNALEVRRVLPDSPAEDAGLERGDEILSVNSRRVSSVEQLQRALAMAAADEECEIGILRDGRKQTVDATLTSRRSARGRGREQRQWNERQYGNQPRGESYGQSGEWGYGRGPRRPGTWRDAEDDGEYSGGYRGDEGGDRAFLGIALDEWSRGGVRVSGVYPESPAEEAGLRRGDEIVAIDDEEVETNRDLQRLLSQRDPDDEVTISVERNGRERTLHATLASQQEVFEASRPPYRVGRRNSDRDRDSDRNGAGNHRRQRNDSQDEGEDDEDD